MTLHGLPASGDQIDSGGDLHTPVTRSGSVNAAAVRDTALAAHEAGLCVVAPREDGSKSPEPEYVEAAYLARVLGEEAASMLLGDRAGAWTWVHRQHERPTRQELERAYSSGRSGVGFVCGAVSGNLELFEFDDLTVYHEYKEAARALGLGDLVERVEAGFLSETPGGGYHWLYQCEEIAGNTKLARRPKRPEEMKGPDDKIAVLIETRGEGGYAVEAPSHGRVHPSGGQYRLLRGALATIVKITPEERRELHDLARTFDQMPRPVFGSGPVSPRGEGRRPGDDFNTRMTWEDVLGPHGWTAVCTRGEETFWKRPGTDNRWSATTNYQGSDLFYCFSTSTEFEAERGYSKFAGCAILDHDGDFQAAARTLGQQGYGEQGSSEGTKDAGPGPESVDPGSFTDIAWPDPPAPEVYHGLAGEIVRVIEPHTEADPIALLVQILTGFGNVVHHGPHFIAEADYHALKLFVVLVGISAKGRKGSSWGRVRRVFEATDRDWTYDRVQSGLSSGEGLIWAVRDPITRMEPVKEGNKRTGEYEEVVVDPGVEDKRLLVLEPEFASVLRVLGREGSTLSAQIRQAWDTGDLRTMVKNSPARATGSHISLIGHVTRAELRRYLDTTEAGNGFGNRFLWIAVRRSRVLPEGGNLDEAELLPLIARLRTAVDVARVTGELQRDDDARAIWREVYPALSEGKPGLLGAMIARAEAQVMRLACIYALLDLSKAVRRDHLMAALGLWDYAEQSARWIFGSSLGDPVADEILTAVRLAPDGLTRTAISELFGRNKSASQIGRALGVLVEHNLARSAREGTDGPGRRPERWFAVRPGD